MKLNKIWKKSLSALLISMMILAVMLFLARNSIATFFIKRAITKIEETYNCQIAFKSAHLKGLKIVVIENLTINPPKGPMLFESDSVVVEASIFKALTGKTRLKSIQIFNSLASIYKTDTLDNISWTLKKDEKNEKGSDSKTLLSEKIAGMVSVVFDLIPDDIHLKNFKILVHYKKKSFKSKIRDFACRDEKYTAIFSLYLDTAPLQPSDTTCLQISGDISKGRKYFSGIVEDQSGSTNIPLVKRLAGVDAKSRRMAFSFDGEKLRDEEVVIKLKGESKGLKVSHPKLSSKPVLVRDCGFDLYLRFKENFIFLDSTSTVSLNKIKLAPFAFLKSRKPRKLTVSMVMAEMDAQDFFNSLPEGAFDSFEGLKVAGTFKYKLKFNYPLSNPEGITFNALLQGEEFKIKDFGKVNFALINSDFFHEVYEKDKLVRTIFVSKTNPAFTPIEEISPYLRYAVLTAEDGGFFSHKGFNEEAFRKSIVENIRLKSFKRGGSTISMQLVKNVFLTRKKTLVRKLEEVLIVWLVENLRLSTKERMFEVYLNIIEWGPGVYGIKEAASFYFNKPPSALTLNESIYLSSIIPRPKSFKWTFDREGNLRAHYQNYYNTLARHMLRRGQITPSDTIGLHPSITLTGPAKYDLRKLPENQERFELPFNTYE